MLPNAYFIASSLCVIFGLARAIEHGTNLIWAQSPAIKVFSQARLVGIQGNPHEWVENRNPQVNYISAPHYTWEFSALTFNWEQQILYWSEGTFKKIQGLTLNGSRETMTVVSGTSSEVYGIAVDWLAQNLYYTDALYNWIMMTPADPGKAAYRIIINEDLDSPHGVAVHPLQGRLFWSDWGVRPKIETSNLLGWNRQTLAEWDMIKPKGLTIDFDNDVLYWVDSFKTTIESINFNGQGRTVLHTDEGSNFYGLAFYEGLLFVTDQSRNGMLKVFNKKQKEVSFTLSNVPFDILMYDQSRQPGNNTDCEDLGCQQLCFQDPVTGARCLCGEGYVLNESDMTTCTYTKQFVHPSHIYAIGDSICQYPANIADMSLTNVTLDSQCFLQGRQAYMTLTFDARNHFLYYFGNKTKTISRIPLELGGKGRILAGGTGIVNGMALDWVSGNLYWTDITHGVIRMGAQDCSYQMVLLVLLGSPFGIAVHPGRRKIYWTDHGHPPEVGASVETANLDGTGREVVMNDNLGTPNHIFIDFKKDNLYWSDSRLNHVRMLNLNTGRITVVLEQPNVRFFGISVFQDFLLWTDQDDLNGIHVARMDKKEKIRGIIHPKNGMASDLITFDINNQPMFESPCAPNVTKCSQLCVAKTSTEAKCLCGRGYKLADDGFSCTTEPVWDNFLLVNDAFQRQIFQINLLNGVPGAVDLKLLHEPIALTYDPYEYKVFWSDNKAHIISEATIEGRYERIVMRFDDTAMCNGLAADYVNKLLFYTDAGNDAIGVVSMIKNDMMAILIDNDLDDPRDIVVSPHEGVIYWTDWGQKPRIEMAYMDGTAREALVAGDDLAWPNGLALDVNAQNLYWVDAQTDSVSVISLRTRTIKKLLTEEGSHYFSLAVIGDYLYINDWKRNYLVRMDKRGGSPKRFGDAEYTRLYGMDGFNSSEAFKGPSVCASSACEQLCLPRDNGRYTCRCSSGYVSDGMNCVVAPSTTTTATTNITMMAGNDTVVGNSTAVPTASPNTAESQSTTTPDVTITKRPTTSAILTSGSGNTTNRGPVTVDTTIQAYSTSTSTKPTQKSRTTTDDYYTVKVRSTAKTDTPASTHGLKTSTYGSGSTVSPKATTNRAGKTSSSRPITKRPTSTYPIKSSEVFSTSTRSGGDDVRAHKSTLTGSSGLSAITIIIIVVAVAILVIVVVAIIAAVMYRRRHRTFIPHDKLVESRSSSMQKIMYSPTEEQPVSFGGGFENPTYDCLHQDPISSSNSSS